jgi:hypothetical protein
VTLQRFQTGVLARFPAQVAALGVPHQQPSLDSQRNGRDGVYVHVKNRSPKITIEVKNRQSGVPRFLKPGESTAFDKDYSSVYDEVELLVSIPKQQDFEIDASNPTIGWPNVTVDGDNENYSQWQERYFVVDETRVVVHRHNDQDDRKRFFIEITPPGSLT